MHLLYYNSCITYFIIYILVNRSESLLLSYYLFIIQNKYSYDSIMTDIVFIITLCLGLIVWLT